MKLHELQTKNLVEGGKCFLLECKIDLSKREQLSKEIGFNMLYDDYMKKLIEVHCPLKVGEEFEVETVSFEECADVPMLEIPKMKIAVPKKHKFKVKSIECIRVQDICDDGRYGDILVDGLVSIESNMANERERKIRKFRKFRQEHCKIFGENAYKDNGYYFLVEVQ